MTIRRRILFLHILFWLLLIGTELAGLFGLSGRLEPYYQYLIFYSVNIGVFYAQLLILDTTFGSGGRRWLRGALLFVALVLTFLAVKLFLVRLLAETERPWTWYFGRFGSFILTSGYRGIYFILLATFYWTARHLHGYRVRALEAEARIMSAENAYLRQQLNPHLMFNALNFIYSSVYRYSEQGARPVYLLSEIMRYALRAPGPDGKVPVREEVAQIERLIEINRCRFRHELPLRTELDQESLAGRVIPLVLFTLVENIFKHADLQSPPEPAVLSLQQADGRLLLRIRNARKHPDAPAPAGTGLRNTRTRLAQAYGTNAQLDIRQDGIFYELTLSLPA